MDTNDGTGLREELQQLQQTWASDAACSRLTRGYRAACDHHAKALGAALSAVAPPPVLEGCAPGWGIAGNYGDGKWRCFREGASQTYLGYPKATANEAIAETHRLAMLAAIPAALAQPEGGDAVLFRYYNELTNTEQAAVEYALKALKVGVWHVKLANDDRAGRAAEALARYIVESRETKP